MLERPSEKLGHLFQGSLKVGGWLLSPQWIQGGKKMPGSPEMFSSKNQATLFTSGKMAFCSPCLSC